MKNNSFTSKEKMNEMVIRLMQASFLESNSTKVKMLLSSEVKRTRSECFVLLIEKRTKLNLGCGIGTGINYQVCCPSINSNVFECLTPTAKKHIKNNKEANRITYVFAHNNGMFYYYASEK